MSGENGLQRARSYCISNCSGEKCGGLFPSRRIEEKTARVEDRSTQDEIKDAAAAYAGSFYMLDTEAVQDFLELLRGFCQYLFLDLVAIQE